MSSAIALVPLDGPVELNANEAPRIIITSVVMGTVATICVLLRYISGRLIRMPWALDDTVVLVTLLLALATTYNLVWGAIYNNYGRHTIFSSVDAIHHFLLGLYVFEITYTTAIASAKFALIKLYYRVFRSHRFAKWLVVVSILNFIWVIVLDFVGIFFCTPVEGFWRFEMSSRCLDKASYFASGAATNIAIDVALLMIPPSIIKKLQMSQSQRIAVSLIFVTGIVVPIVAAFRLNELLVAVNGPINIDPTYVFVGPGLWSVIEVNLAVVVACLPSMRPLLRFAIHGTLKDTSRRLAANVPRSFSTKPRRDFSSMLWSRSTQIDDSNFSMIEEDQSIGTAHVHLAQLDKALPRIPRCDDQIWVDHEVEIGYALLEDSNGAQNMTPRVETRSFSPTADSVGVRTFETLRQKRSSSLKPPNSRNQARD